MATINKTRPSCARVNVQVDLLPNHPKVVSMEIKNDSTRETRSKNIKIQYDYMPKYFKECNLQGHEEIDWRILHLELKPQRMEIEAVAMEKTNQKPQAQSSEHTYPPRMLASGKIVGDSNAWAVIKDNMIFSKEREESRNKTQEGSNNNANVNTENKFDTLMNVEEDKLEATSQQKLENGEVPQTNIEADNSTKSQISTKQWIESTFKSPKRVIEIVTQEAAREDGNRKEVEVAEGEGTEVEKAERGVNEPDEQVIEAAHYSMTTRDKTTAVREQDQVSSTENTKHSPNRSLHEICSHEGVKINIVLEERNTSKEVDKYDHLKQNLEEVLKQLAIHRVKLKWVLDNNSEERLFKGKKRRFRSMAEGSS
ncbi:hypothetical protein HAX54_032837 [Datura stramonium]|uniref:Uncharacterized protein n=1 Tax=Datura stramonium TaxID=4076 RepID=A0ABS8VBD1_DATST|nr:hypothetical protein [Datura stramonium]